MQLLYLDESGGDDIKASDKFFVLAGLSVSERVPYYLCGDVDEIQKKVTPAATEQKELRASAIWSGNGEPWASMPRPERVALMKAIYKLIGGDGRITLFGIALEKPDYPSVSPIQKTCEEIAGRFDAHLTTLEMAPNAEKQRGLMIFDQSRHEKTVQGLLTQYRTTGANFGKVRHLAEVPLFTDSKITRMLQLADFVAYAIYRRYESSDAQFLDIILPRFTESAGKLHGLVHLNARFRECFCQPCFSHR